MQPIVWMNAKTARRIKFLYDHYGMIFDPHSAVGLEAAKAARDDEVVSKNIPIISLACAHPAKFPDAVENAIGVRPALPQHLFDLMDRQESKIDIDGKVEAIKELIFINKRN